MSAQIEKSESILLKLFDSIKTSYHYFIEFFLSLNDLTPEEQDNLSEKFIEELTLASMASQDIDKSLTSSCALAGALVGLKNIKKIGMKFNDLLNRGCPCDACQASGNPISLKMTKSLIAMEMKISPNPKEEDSTLTTLKNSASKLDKKLN